MESELVAILQREADAERERLLSEATAQADQIIAEAQKEAETYLAARRQELEADRHNARTRAESAAQVRAAALVLQAKDHALADVFAKVEAELARVAQDRSRYTALLRGLIREAAAGLDGRLVVEVHPSDLELARTVVRELKLDAEVKPSEDVRGGARLATENGRFVVENTLASRIERVKSVVAPEVAALLWGTAREERGSEGARERGSQHA
jgi:vacuolar-type H+-ATPase subunit E/Vma4